MLRYKSIFKSNALLKPKGLLAIKLAVSIGLVLLLVRQVNIEDFLAGFTQANIPIFGIALGLSAVAVLIRSYKWQLLLGVQGANLPLRTIQAITYMSMFFNNFFLGSIGGDAFRVYKTLNYSRTKSGSISSVLMERATGVWASVLVLLASSIATLFIGDSVILPRQLFQLIGVSLATLFLTVAGFMLMMRVRHFNMLDKFPKLAIFVHSFVVTIHLYRIHVVTLLTTVILSLLFLMTNSVATYFYALAANVTVHFIHLIFIVTLAGIITMLPISINGIGLQEGAIFIYLERLGVDPSSALLVALLPRIGMLLFAFLGGLLFLHDEVIGKNDRSGKPVASLGDNKASD
jgi:uncharacterized protein (TIRG00374 family)